MSALAELHAGSAGTEFSAELQRTIRAVGISRNFPAPEGHDRWDAGAVQSAASEFMSDAQTPRRLTDLALHCASDDALRARLQGTIRNFLADLGRRTPVGKLVVRINEVLSREPGFVRTQGRWAIKQGQASPGTDDPARLSAAIRHLTVVVPAWGHDARRSAPVADRETIVTHCQALLDAAGGSLTPRTLARSIGERLGIGQAPVALEVAGLDSPAMSASRLADSTGSEAVRLVRAREVFTELDDRERVTVAYPEYTVRQLAPALGVSASQAHLIRRRAAEVIRIELLDDDDAEGIAMLVMELARIWADTVDSDAGSAVLVAR